MSANDKEVFTVADGIRYVEQEARREERERILKLLEEYKTTLLEEYKKTRDSISYEVLRRIRKKIAEGK